MSCVVAMALFEHYGVLAFGVLVIMLIYVGGRWLMTREDRR